MTFSQKKYDTWIYFISLKFKLITMHIKIQDKPGGKGTNKKRIGRRH